MTMDEAQVVVESIELGITGTGLICLIFAVIFIVLDVILHVRSWWNKRKNKVLIGKSNDPVIGLVLLREDLEEKREHAQKTLKNIERMIADIDLQLEKIRQDNINYGWRKD